MIEEITYPLDGVILDGVFGFSFHGTVEERSPPALKEANNAGLPIIDVNIPSGLDSETGQHGESVINASETAFLGLPSSGFFIVAGMPWASSVLSILVYRGDYIEDLFSDMEMLDDLLMIPSFACNPATATIQAGYVLGVAGSQDMPGSAILSSISALRSDCRTLCVLFHPWHGLCSLPVLEIVKSPFTPKNIDPILTELKRARYYIGPGLGKEAFAADDESSPARNFSPAS